MTVGFCSQPVEVVSETASMFTVRDLRDGDEFKRKKSGIAFICDTTEEGWAMHNASMAFVKAEQKIAQQQAMEFAARKRRAIEDVMLRPNAGVKRRAAFRASAWTTSYVSVASMLAPNLPRFL